MTKVTFDKFYNVIDGKTVEAKNTRTGINPATKEKLPPVPVSSKEDLNKAVASARAAFKGWATTSWADRKKAIEKWLEAMVEQKEDFAQMLTKEQGKPLKFAQQEVDSSYKTASKLLTFELKTETVSDTNEKLIQLRYTPLGVVGAIIPWNFPIITFTNKVIPALITGNTLILKPSPFTPYCDLKLVELAQQFLPKGVINALSGDDDLGPWITAHPDIDKISFTGSTATGKKVMESCSKTLKRVTLELGGNDPAIICPDVDVKAVAPQIATLAFLNSGQICLALKRIYVHKDIYQPFLEAMVEYTKSLTVGPGHEDVFMGPIQNSMQYDRVKTFFDDIKTQGQKVAQGGQVVESGGYFIHPTIIDNPKDDSKIVVEEPFGPIVPLLQWENEDEVIARANNTDMGLGASVWGKDLNRARRIAEQIQAGSVWVNEHMAIDPGASFGGHKGSGIGTELGKHGMISYCNLQSLYVKKDAKI